MVSKTKIRNYKSKKYANTLKNKKRSKMRGGHRYRKGTRRTTQHPPEEYTPSLPQLLLPPPPKVKTQMENFIDSYECPSKLQFMHVDIPDFEFKKYSCHYNKSENYEKHMSYLYFKKTHIGEELNLDFEVYKVYAPNNQSISIEHKILNPKHEKYKEFGKLYDITPLELSVDTMQLAINTGKLKMSTDKDGNSYLGFVDFPSLVINEKYAGSGFSYTSREYANWISVYEEKFDYDNDKLFELIVTSEDIHIDKHALDLEIKIMQDKIQILKANKRNSDIEKIEELNVKIGELHTEKSKPVITMSNEELFIMKQNEMRTLLEGVKTLDIDKKDTEKQKIVEQVKYRAYVSLEGEEDSGDIGNKNIISENIGWVMQNALWLEKYLKIKTEDNRLTAQELQNEIGEKYECDLFGLDEKYIIVDDTIINGEEYVICGYPDKNMKAIIINFWQEEKMRKMLDKVHQKQNDTFYKWFSNLFNKYIDEEIKEKVIKKKDITELQNYKITNNSELYKIYKKQRQKFIIDYINDRYEKLATTPEEKSIYDNFKIQYNTNIEAYFQEIATKYMNKIISYIKYIFIVYKKDKKNGNLIPFIFNIKELSNTHVPILERINKLIKNKLPSIFDIQEEYNTVDKYNTPDYNPDNEYKLFYTRYKYGKFFHIETEYLHTMTNVGYKAHIYKNSITLEEIQYASTIDIPYWKNIKFNYEVREHMLSNTTVKKQRSNNPIFRSETVLDAYIKDRIDKNDDRYDIEINAKNQSISIDSSRMKIEKKEQSLQNKEIKKTLETINLQKAIIILMYKNSNNNYTFIFIYNNNFYSITFAPNLKYEIDNIINKLHNNELHNGNINIYKINECKQLDHEDYTTIFKYNPIILKQARQFSKDSNGENNNIDTSYFYDSNMLTPNNVPNYKTLIMPNLFIKSKPYLYLNNTKSIKYLLNYNEYKKTNKQKECLIEKYEEKFTNCEMRLCNPEEIIINCIFYNVNNCNYDFLEFIDNKDQKIVIYVFPHIGLPEKENELYIGNYLNLDGNKPTTMLMLNAIRNMYSNENYVCFLHITITPIFNTLHFHIVSNEHYKRIFPKKEMGGYMIQDMFIDDVINNLEINPNYYKNLNFNLLKQY